MRLECKKQNGVSATLSPTKLMWDASERIDKLIRFYDSLGFKQEGYLTVQIESHPCAIKGVRLDENKVLVPVDEYAGPYVGGTLFYAQLLPNWKGKYTLRFDTGLLSLLTSNSRWHSGRTLHLPFLNANEHCLYQDSVLPHEMAHVFEKPKSQNSFIWSEARADFLSYLYTSAPGFELNLQLPDGSLSTVGRSLEEPSIRHINEIDASMERYHKNSTLLSSLLFDLHQIIGTGRVVKIIQSIDQSVIYKPFDDYGNQLSERETESKFNDPTISLYEIKKSITSYSEAIYHLVLNPASSTEEKTRVERAFKKRGLR